VPDVLRRLSAFVRLGRPHFLGGGFVLYALGAALAAYEGHAIDLRAYAVGQVAITLTQLMTHYANDYFDLAADRANATATLWSGGSRVLPAGELSPRVALVAALVLGALALAVDFGLVPRTGGARALPLLLAALVLSWEYSAPPLRLHSRGLGAPTVALVVAVMTPLVGYLVEAPLRTVGFVPLPILVVAPLACAQLVMIQILDIPDAAGDAAAGKRTLMVRRGPAFASRLALALVVAAYASMPLLVVLGLPNRAALALALTLPIAAPVAWGLARGTWRDPARMGGLAFAGVAWFVALALAELAAFVSLIAGW
jgi:1,4-dihydroxy-2-naphthoate polyprenyltransferase